MTITNAIERADRSAPNNYTSADKIRWLSLLDGRIKQEIIDRHEGAQAVVFTEYGDDVEQELLVPAPYDELYLHWLCAMIYYAGGEIARYNNALARFDEDYKAFAKKYTSEHMPRASGKRFLF